MDLDDRVSALIGQLIDFGEGVIELPEILTLDDQVDPVRLLDTFELILFRCHNELPAWRELYYHPKPGRPGVLYFHGHGVKHGSLNA